MKAATLISLIRSGQLPVVLRAAGLLEPVYRAFFLAAASSHGVLRLLAEAPVALPELARSLAAGPEDQELLRTWLDFGVRLGELGRRGDRYRLKGFWARKLADPRQDITAATLEEALRFHTAALLEAPAMLRGRRGRFSLADQDGALIARSTRILDPFVREAMDDLLPRSGSARLLDIGCGEGGHVLYACARNPALLGTAVELQQRVAEVARSRLAVAGLTRRVDVIEGDVRHVDIAPSSFDFATLHNAIYYFRSEERVPLLTRIRKLLVPGGRLLVTTGCRGGNLGLDAVDLWYAASNAGGRLPTPDALLTQLREAGFSRPSARSLISGDRYFAFSATVDGCATPA